MNHDSEVHYAGYFGASAEQAGMIERQGFADSEKPVMLRTLYDLSAAIQDGAACAGEGDTTYAVVHVGFPDRPLTRENWHTTFPVAAGELVFRTVMYYPVETE